MQSIQELSLMSVVSLTLGRLSKISIKEKNIKFKIEIAKGTN